MWVIIAILIQQADKCSQCMSGIIEHRVTGVARSEEKDSGVILWLRFFIVNS